MPTDSLSQMLWIWTSKFAEESWSWSEEIWLFLGLTHWGLVTPYGDRDAVNILVIAGSLKKIFEIIIFDK